MAKAKPGPRDLKRHCAGGGKVVNGWCSIPSPVSAEIVARAGFDSLTIDLQHGLIDFGSALPMLQAIDGLGAPTLCRVPWNEPGIIMKALDAGFGGIICPMVNTKEEAVRFAAACRYAPRGSRSFGPIRAGVTFGADYAGAANDFVTTFAMIETREALDNLDDILTVEEIDAIYIGPSDLSLSLGHAPTLLHEKGEVTDAIETIRSKAKAAGKVAGIHCGSSAMVRAMLDGGFDLATLLTDARILTAGLAAALAEVGSGTAASTTSGPY